MSQQILQTEPFYIGVDRLEARDLTADRTLALRGCFQ